CARGEGDGLDSW
nr:immunoglobulin heavy chain junction region [Macaca mulatta]MOW19693.1 immunoglobulin heavy chain junction region [Macaca mulatta]MOW19785.1 immunoglobulin heavy chain junction region [Macaca mulatta]MOW20652.1 immunoglobulin heavy chain junction region [Macaca mulatta]MOW20881.1 immunoglobulin heavy chain junction region [Macaca mulatta]